MIALIGPTDLFTSAWCQQDSHVMAWRLHWHMRGVALPANSIPHDLRGTHYPGSTLSQIAQHYGR